MSKQILIKSILSSVIVFCSTNLLAQNYQLHSVFLYSFTRYVQWPEESNTGDFDILVLGDSPILPELKKMADLKKVGIQLNNNIRVSIGYNSGRYFAGIHYVDLTTRSQSPVPDTYQTMGAGNFRISFARRFTLKKQLF